MSGFVLGLLVALGVVVAAVVAVCAWAAIRVVDEMDR